MASSHSTQFAFRLVHTVQFSETDMAGVVHFSNLFRWMEEVEHAFFRSLGLSVQMSHGGEHIGWPRVSTSCEYFAPAKFEDRIELRMRLTKLGGKSLNYEVDFMRGDQRIAHGKMATVCCALGREGMSAIQIPPAIRQKLEKALGQQTEVESKQNSE